MPTNVLLVRWKGGWHEVVETQSVNTYFRQEAFLSLGALQDIHEVNRVASLQLSVVAWPRDAIAVDHDPIDRNDRPYRAYNVGDTIIVPRFGTGTYAQRVRALTGSEDDEGNVTYAPELGDLLLEEGERTLQAVKKMIDGTLGGESPVAQPAPAVYPIAAQSIPKPRLTALGLHGVHPAGGNGESDPYSDTTSVAITNFRMRGNQGGATDLVTGGVRIGSGDATSVVARIDTNEPDFDLTVDVPVATVDETHMARFFLQGDVSAEGLTVDMWAGSPGTGQWVELPWWGGG
jgi:hypothetical protein